MTETTEVVVRLHPEELRKLRALLGGEAINRVTSTTTPHEAGYKLGINHVLSVLAEGFTTA